MITSKMLKIPYYTLRQQIRKFGNKTGKFDTSLRMSKEENIVQLNKKLLENREKMKKKIKEVRDDYIKLKYDPPLIDYDVTGNEYYGYPLHKKK